MLDFAHFIQEIGTDEYFGNKVFRVLVIDDMKYWTMDDPIENIDCRQILQSKLKGESSKA